MIVVNTAYPKLCHTKPGDAVRLLHPETGHPSDDLFVVSVFNQVGKKPARPFRSEGLYDEGRPLFLVNLSTGHALEMPHLSSRVEIVRTVQVVFTP